MAFKKWHFESRRFVDLETAPNSILCEMLDQAPIPPKHIEEIGSKFSEYSKIAEKSWLLEKLTGHDIGIEEIPEEQIAIWVFKNKDDFKSRYSVIANFLKNGAKPADSSLQRFEIILSK